MTDENKDVNTPISQENPWEKLSDKERKRAEGHLILLYAFMIILVVLPFVVFFVFKK